MVTLFSMGSSIASNFQNGYFIADFLLSTLLVLLVTGFLAYEVRRVPVFIVYGVLDFLFLLGFILNLPWLVFTASLFLVIITIVCLIVNAGLVRKYIAVPLKSKQKSSTSITNYDKEKLIDNIVTAVKWLSDNKEGALITFERNTPLDDVLQSGTRIDCPVTPEIIETIFFEGSRLHDGAIIIRGNIIVAAAVYYQPSNKTIVGKFGARHRAALGISEVTDSITVVVSEETGRISIAHGGMMDNVKMMEFEKIFRNCIG